MFNTKIHNPLPKTGRRSPLVAAPAPGRGVGRSWPQQLGATLKQFERERLDPLLDQLFRLWGDSRHRQQQLLRGGRQENTLLTTLAAEERQINRGLYVSATSFGLAVAGALFWPPLRLLSLPGLLYGSLHVYKSAYNGVIHEHTVKVDLLAALVNIAYLGSGMFVLGNLTGKLHIAIEQAGAETTVDRVNQILAQTIDYRSTRQLQFQQLTDRLVTPALGLAAITLPFLGPMRAAAVLDAHPQRQLNILGSLAILNFLIAAAEQGILIKDGRSLELLSEVDTLAFDKTGTLTQEQPQVTAIHLCAGLTEDQLLTYAAAAEERQSHPIARALLAEATARRLALPTPDQVRYQAGFGLAVTIAEQTVHVGSARFMTGEGITIPPGIEQLQDTCHRQGHSLVLVAVGGELAGAIELQTTLRPEVKTVISALRRLPRLKSILLVSGDQPAPTRRLAAEIGADEYFAEILPAGKADLIAQLQRRGRKVCFVGDGINDAVALKQANVSISLRGAMTAATDTAHLVLMNESLHQLLPLFELVGRFDATQRNTMLTILGTGAFGAAGVYFLGFGLAETTILDRLALAVGTGTAMRPWLTERG
jgi:cation transport ATPase